MANLTFRVSKYLAASNVPENFRFALRFALSTSLVGRGHSSQLCRCVDIQSNRPVRFSSTATEIRTANQHSEEPRLAKNDFHKRTEEDHARLITAKLKRLSGSDQRRFFDAVCQMGRANRFHFNTMISRQNHPDDGVALLNRMEGMSIVPDVVTYTSIIDLEVIASL